MRRIASHPPILRRTLQWVRFKNVQKIEATKKMVDDLFSKRSSRKARVAMLRQQETEAQNASAPLSKSTRPVTFADDIDDRVPHGSAQNDALQPVDDPEFSVLLDDNFTYFPADETVSAAARVVPGQSFPAPGMRRYRMELQFRGDHYLGWDRASEMRRRRKELARRLGEASTEAEAENVTWAGHALSGLSSVRDAVQEALSIALDVTTVKVVPSVSVETGVHARRLTCHVDIPSDTLMQPRTVLQRSHAWLVSKDEPLGILSFQPAPLDFHSAASATRRVYVYRILNRISPPVFDIGLQWHVDRYLDVDLMNAAAQSLLCGTQDFGALASGQVRGTRRVGTMHTVRTIDEIRIERQEDEVLIWFVGKSFLRHQLRYMASVLKYIGQRVWVEDDLRWLMDRGFTKKGFATGRPPAAPAYGLSLWEVQYPASIGSTPDFVDSGTIEDAAHARHEQDEQEHATNPQASLSQ